MCQYVSCFVFHVRLRADIGYRLINLRKRFVSIFIFAPKLLTSYVQFSCFLTLTLQEKSRVRGHTQVLEPRRIRKNKIYKNSSCKFYAFPALNARYEEGAQVKRSNVQTELTWPRVSTQLQHTCRVPPFPQLTNSRLQTTAVGLSAQYEPHGNREHRRTRLRSGVLLE